MNYRVYLAHPVTDYGSLRQAVAIAAIVAAGFQIENPDLPHHRAAYRERGMDHFREVVADCDGLVFMRFPCGAIGAGVAKEIETALRCGLPVWEFAGDSLVGAGDMMPAPVLNVDETRRLVRRLSGEVA